MSTLKDKMNHLNPKRREKVEARAAQLIAEEMTRQELRRARKLTQVSLAKALGITQDGVSRMEKRTDLLLSTLREYVEAMGGRLSLIAEFHDREPVLLSGIAEEEVEPRRAARKPSRAGRKSVVIKPQKSANSAPSRCKYWHCARRDNLGLRGGSTGDATSTGRTSGARSGVPRRGGLVDAPGRRLVGAKGEYPFVRPSMTRPPPVNV